MVEDKYIGLVVAISGSLAIGTSFIITKKVGKYTVLNFQKAHIVSETLGSEPSWTRLRIGKCIG